MVEYSDYIHDIVKTKKVQFVFLVFYYIYA